MLVVDEASLATLDEAAEELVAAEELDDETAVSAVAFRVDEIWLLLEIVSALALTPLMLVEAVLTIIDANAAAETITILDVLFFSMLNNLFKVDFNCFFYDIVCIFFTLLFWRCKRGLFIFLNLDAGFIRVCRELVQLRL